MHSPTVWIVETGLITFMKWDCFFRYYLLYRYILWVLLEYKLAVLLYGSRRQKALQHSNWLATTTPLGKKETRGGQLDSTEKVKCACVVHVFNSFYAKRTSEFFFTNYTFMLECLQDKVVFLAKFWKKLRWSTSRYEVDTYYYNMQSTPLLA